MLNGFDYLETLTKWRGGKFDLAGMRLACEVLGNPQDKVPTFHIGGTNGKGSVSVFTGSILGACGFKVGLTVSPHLSSLNERIVIDGLPVSDSLLDDGLKAVAWASKKGSVTLSYHEALTLASFWIFEKARVDFSIVEVGLGGRLDASNVVTRPLSAAIVSIGHDHEDVLGKGLLNIAREKAGIIKGGHRVVLGEIAEEPRRVIFEEARYKSSSPLVYGDDFGVKSLPNGLYEYFVNSIDAGHTHLLEPILKGKHQLHNAAVASALVADLNLPSLRKERGIKGAFWPGRLESVSFQGKEILFDCAHNPEGIQRLVEFLKDEQLQDVNLGFGVLESKNWREMTDIILPYVAELHLASVNSDRGLPTRDLREYLSGSRIRVFEHGANREALLRGVTSGSNPSVLAGSIYLVGELRSLLDTPQRPLWQRVST